MDAFLKRREGPGASLWDMLVREVFEPIGAFHVPSLRTIEPDGSRGVPLLSYGLFLTVDDVAKLATLLQSGGRHEGQQILHPAKLAEALYRTSPDAGLPVGWKFRAGAGRYHLSFWSMPYRTSRRLLRADPVHVGLRRQSRRAAAERRHDLPVHRRACRARRTSRA